MRILVTGGAGFIGSHIVDNLVERGHEVAIFDDLSSGSRSNCRPHVPLYVDDIRDRDAVLAACREFRPDAICHQAAQLSVSRSVREPVFDAECNVLGLLHMLEAAVDVEAKTFVFASSGGVIYGDVTTPATESFPANPVSPYGISKWTGERYLRFFAETHGLATIALRYSNVYGPRQNPHGEAGVVAIFCEKMLQTATPRINGDGKYVRDYVYVSDVVEANRLSLEQAAPGFVPLNVGTGHGTDVNELAAIIRRECQAALRERGTVVELSSPTHGPPRPGDLRSNLLSSDGIHNLFSWRPKVGIDEGLRRTVQWFADRASA